MDSKKIIKGKLFFVALVTMLCSVVAGGCSDDKDELEGKQYGYVQFKLYKSASYAQENATRTDVKTTRATELEKLSEARKVEIEMQYNSMSITQTLVLNAYNEENAEYGMKSDKLQLLTGNYRIVGYKLLDKLDEVIVGISAGSDENFEVVSRGLTLKDLVVDSQPRGTVTFKLVKSGLNTRAADGEEIDYLFSDIKIIDVTVTNTFTRIPTVIKNLKVTYKEEYEEHPNTDYTDDNNSNKDKYKDIGTARCDSAVWLPGGTYQVTSYTIYKKSGVLVTLLDSRNQLDGNEMFTVEDNRLTKDAVVPIQLSPVATYIKDYKALKAIWEALDGQNWSYHGEVSPAGSTWNFNKEIDMWGNQPGVSLDSKGRVISLSLEGFGAKGRVPDAIGQLTELKVLSIGSHNEKLGGRLFAAGGITPDMSDAQRQKMRMHYKELFLDYDPRENMSELLQDGINRDPNLPDIRKSNRITQKDIQIGQTTNTITFVSKAVMRLKKLQQLYIANSPIKAENICTEWENANSEYAREYEEESKSWGWRNFTDLTDIEVYNCPNLTRLPEFLFELPEIQLLNIANNQGIDGLNGAKDGTGEQLTDDWKRLADAPVGAKLQILYLGYNNLTAFPPYESLNKMRKLGLLDCINNKLTGTLSAFGKEVELTTLTLSYNQIDDIPDNFCGFTDQVETLDLSHNRIEYIPNIFDAASVYVMKTVNLSYNRIGKNGPNIKGSLEDFRGINASAVILANNLITQFPTELFAKGSPISTIDLSNNLMKEVPENSLRSENGNYKNTHLLSVIDLRFNKLTKLSDDFRATTLPYLTNIDLGYNCFSKFPTAPLNSSKLQAIGIRYQRDAAGNRILREWPTGITTCPSLIQLQIGSNDIRKVNESLTGQLYIVDIKDNPNISIDVTSVCPYIKAGRYKLIYDKTQDIRGCDALDIK